jgi:hypothetical protein
VPLHRGDYAVLRQAYSAIVNKTRRASHLADATHQPDRPTKSVESTIFFWENRPQFQNNLKQLNLYLMSNWLGVGYSMP